MKAPTRLVAFAAILAVVFGGAALAGAAIDPTDKPAPAADPGHGEGHKAAAQDEGAGHGGSAPVASGLAVSEGGYGLEVDRRFFDAGQSAPFAFRITDAGGRVVRDELEPQHEKELHLIVVRRDTAVFQHLHPRKGRDGTWSIELNLPEPGVYRAYADVKIDGEARALATDLFVPGDFRPNRLPPPASVAPAVYAGDTPADDLDVTLKAPGVRAGRETPLTFAVARAGQPFERLEPYLGAKGHLVALREGDLAYLHVHPTEDANANEVPFMATFPTAGRYRLFLQLKVGGEVRTAAYTVEVPR